jgi:hypothetical protein
MPPESGGRFIVFEFEATTDTSKPEMVRPLQKEITITLPN